MSAQTERILRTPARRGRWVMVALAAAIAVGAAIVLPRVLSGSSHVQATNGGRSTTTTPREYANQVVTGTGPGLVQVAEQSRAARLVTVERLRLAGVDRAEVSTRHAPPRGCPEGRYGFSPVTTSWYRR